MAISTRKQILDDSSKWLYFRGSVSAYSCYPVNSLTGFSELGTSATTLVVYFTPQGTHSSSYFDYVELTVTSHEAAIKDIMDAINFSKKTVITVADDTTSNYLSNNISATDGMNTTVTGGGTSPAIK